MFNFFNRKKTPATIPPVLDMVREDIQYKRDFHASQVTRWDGIATTATQMRDDHERARQAFDEALISMMHEPHDYEWSEPLIIAEHENV